jgi:hypothetical protein
MCIVDLINLVSVLDVGSVFPLLAFIRQALIKSLKTPDMEAVRGCVGAHQKKQKVILGVPRLTVQGEVTS